ALDFPRRYFAPYLDPRSLLQALKHGPHLLFYERPLFFDNKDLVQALHKLGDDALIQWPGHAQLQQPDAGLFGGAIVQAKLLQRAAYVPPALAGRYDAQDRFIGIEENAVQSIGARIGKS